MQVNSDKIEGTENRLPKILFETTWHKIYLIKHFIHQVGCLHASTPDITTSNFKSRNLTNDSTDVEIAATITQANRVQISVYRDGTSQFK